ncbi:phosphomannomutase [Pseudoteredinibacter isoporae]|uniref:phosphomannomutase n=1 Tax=Pseudoteredinibacter isoporae TaxID=570281 RepID=A0A7X0JRJ4_9GAMM|nr:phosphomannomutase [Pseudoteredinibacter isoporae]MBB6520852.1 phosphomannomutase [Pseudoteredinibacter isoporae]NHO86417.1 phosphomannomutase [Pseudoteredinibacter isoporae]NIB25131.1 phosphomannomutase [Pseudoteredinibacter isoporae]
MSTLTCFKAYDIRGRVPDQLNEAIAYRIGCAFVEFLGAKSVVVGHDVRLSSESLTNALIEGITDMGANVIHIGRCGTEEVYFAAFDQPVDGGICVTASHNPMDYNGMKFVREGAKPISGDTGLKQIQALAEADNFSKAEKKGEVNHLDSRPRYVQHLLSYVNVEELSPLKIVVNAGNGGAGEVIDALESHLPFEFIKVHHEADGNFPNGIPNPLLVENRAPTAEAVITHGADLGVAWDGDFDRCFFFDAKGQFIEGYYVVGLLADAFLAKNAGAKVVHDPRLIWNTQAICETAGGHAVQSKTGHAFIKERMRLEDAVYGGEMSAHHYFKDFAYCDSGMIPWLLVTELMSRKQESLESMVVERTKAFPCSGEINSTVGDTDALLKSIADRYSADALARDETDGLSFDMGDWRFNLRRSNTEPVVRLNVESKADIPLMEQKRDELLALIKTF